VAISSILALYFISWWITLFAVLPLWVRGQHEDGEVTEGTEPGAPLLPRMGMKVLLTTVLAIPVAAGLWALIAFID
jgi:predicted secreted protein